MNAIDTPRMRRLDEQFAVNPNESVLPTWRRAMAAIEGRLRDLEAQRADYEHAIRRFEELALARINEVLLPILERLTDAATLGFLLARSGTEGSLIADERIQFVVDEGSQRELFTPTPFVAVQRASTTDDFAVGYVEAYDRPTGYLLVKILSAYGSPGPFNDWVISAAPGVSEATRSYWERSLIAAQGAERDAAQTAEDRRYVEAAREALEEAGLNPDQYVWRDGTRPFTAVITGVAPDAMADNATLPTAFWTRRRVQEGVASLQTGAPATLNTFARVAAAVGNDPNFAANTRAALDQKLPVTGGAVEGDLSVRGGSLTVVGDQRIAVAGAAAGDHARLLLTTPGQENMILGLASNGNVGCWTQAGTRRFLSTPGGGFQTEGAAGYSIAGFFDASGAGWRSVHALTANPGWTEIRIQAVFSTLGNQWAGWRFDLGGFAWFDLRHDGRKISSHPGGWEQESDARIKNIGRAYERGLAEIKRLRPIHFTFKREPAFATDRREFVGLTAQNLEDAGLSEFVNTNAGEVEGERVDDLRSFDPSLLIYPLINAVNELAARVERLEART